MGFGPDREGGVKQRKLTAICGIEIDPFAVHTMLILTIPGSEERERAPVVKTLLTADGELVFITKPYENLAADSGSGLRERMK